MTSADLAEALKTANEEHEAGVRADEVARKALTEAQTQYAFQMTETNLEAVREAEKTAGNTRRQVDALRMRLDSAQRAYESAVRAEETEALAKHERDADAVAIMSKLADKLAERAIARDREARADEAEAREVARGQQETVQKARELAAKLGTTTRATYVRADDVRVIVAHAVARDRVAAGAERSKAELFGRPIYDAFIIHPDTKRRVENPLCDAEQFEMAAKHLAAKGA